MRLTDAYRFPGFRPRAMLRGVFGDRKARVITLIRRSKKLSAARPGQRITVGTTARYVAHATCPNGDTRIYLEFEVRRVACRSCGQVNCERLAFLADNTHYTERFAYYVGRRCRAATVHDVAKELHLDWHAVKDLEKQYMRVQLARVGTPGPEAIGIDEISIRKGHTYRIVVSDLIRRRPIWFGARTAKKRAWRCSTTGSAKRRPRAFAWR
jgi:transposase